MGTNFGTAFQECRIGESQFCVIDEHKDFHFRRKVKKTEEKQKLISTSDTDHSNTNTNTNTGTNTDDPSSNIMQNGEQLISIETTDSQKILDHLNNSTNVK